MKKRFISAILASVMLLFCVVIPSEAAAATTPLNEETKADYYVEYIEIAKEVSEEMDCEISVLPMDEFQEEDWCTPEEFRELIITIANWNLTCVDSETMQTRAVYSTKSTTVSAKGTDYTLSVSGSFETMLNPNIKRQIFKKVNSITSSLTGGTGTWTQTGYETKGLDAGRTYGIHVSGTLKIAGATFSNRVAYVEFYCSDTGYVD